MRVSSLTSTPRTCQLIGLLISALVTFISAAQAQFADNIPPLTQASRVNENAISVVFDYEEQYRQMLLTIDADLNEIANVRIVPVIGVSQLQSVYDLLYLQGIDLGIIQADVLEYLARTQDYSEVRELINSVAKLDEKKLTIIAHRDYQSIEDLASEPVNFGPVGHAADITGSLVFDVLGIDVQRRDLSHREALEQLKSGEIAATVYVFREANEAYRQLSAQDNVSVIAIPQTEALLASYLSSELNHRDLPELIAEGQTVSTISVATIIASYNWPVSDQWRHARLKSFVDAFVERFDDVKAGNEHVPWDNAALFDDVPGVTRFSLVDDAIAERAAEAQQLADAAAAEKNRLLLQEAARVRERLAARLAEKIANASDPEEIDRLLNQLNDILAAPAD